MFNAGELLKLTPIILHTQSSLKRRFKTTAPYNMFNLRLLRYGVIVAVVIEDLTWLNCSLRAAFFYAG